MNYKCDLIKWIVCHKTMLFYEYFSKRGLARACLDAGQMHLAESWPNGFRSGLEFCFDDVFR
jgi:hypothetical protein